MKRPPLALAAHGRVSDRFGERQGADGRQCNGSGNPEDAAGFTCR